MEEATAMATVRFLPFLTFSTNGVCLAEMTSSLTRGAIQVSPLVVPFHRRSSASHVRFSPGVQPNVSAMDGTSCWPGRLSLWDLGPGWQDLP